MGFYNCTKHFKCLVFAEVDVPEYDFPWNAELEFWVVSVPSDEESEHDNSLDGPLRNDEEHHVAEAFEPSLPGEQVEVSIDAGGLWVAIIECEICKDVIIAVVVISKDGAGDENPEMKGLTS